MNNPNEADIRQKVWSLVNALPHRGVILEVDAKSWVDEVVRMHGAMAIWHAIRLNGFGGSEIGVLVRNKAGVRADHQASAHEIIEGKLMRRAPLESSAHMRRGNENEEAHAQRFWAKYGAVRDQAAYDALKNVKGSHPWMRYSPDDMVRMPVAMAQDSEGVWKAVAAPGQTKLWLIDYKAPSSVEESDEIAFQYACQLTQGAILCAEAGIELDGMMLSQFDWANWSLKDDAVLWQEDLGRMVLDAGDHYWQMVLRGEVPPYIRTPKLEGVEQYVTDYAKAAQTYASLAALKDAAEKRAAEIRTLMLEPIGKRRFQDAKLAFGAGNNAVLSISANKMLDREAALRLLPPEALDRCGGALAYDEAALVAHLKSLNVDLKPFRKRDLDPVKVYAAAGELGLDADFLVREQLIFRTGKGIKDQMADYIDQHYPLAAVMASSQASTAQQAANDESLNDMDEAADEAAPAPGMASG
jgi:hypothetical protein